MKRNPLKGPGHDVFWDRGQTLTDGARCHWRLYLGKHGMGAFVTKQLPGQDQEFVCGLETYYMGSIYQGGDGRLYHDGFDVNGNQSTSEAIPGWTATKSTR
jgi:hypothetical protein